MCTNIVDISTEVNDIPDFISDSRLSTTVWFSGCSLNCEGCHNTSIKAVREGYTLQYIKQELKDRRVLTDWVVFMGGEPLNTVVSTRLLGELVKYAKKELGYKVFLYTGFDIDQIKFRIGLDSAYYTHDLLEYVDYIKSGVYDMNFDKKKYDDSYYLATVNQYIYQGDKKVYYYDTDVNSIIKEI
jgi:organic radical activating enzyme